MSTVRLPFAAVPVIAVLAAFVVGVSHGPAEERECEAYGTSVLFAESTADAARYAMEEEKLLFVLHVSGHFEESDFT